MPVGSVMRPCLRSLTACGDLPMARASSVCDQPMASSALMRSDHESVFMTAKIRHSAGNVKRLTVPCFRSNSVMINAPIPFTVGTRIRAEREAQKISRSELAKAAGIASTTLSDLELGLSKSTGALYKIARRLNVLPEWLETGRGPKTPEIQLALANDIPPPGYIRFRLMEGAASAGEGAVNDDFPEVLQEVDIAEWQVRSQIGFVPKGDHVQIITVRGDSMSPDINNGDVVMVDTNIQSYEGDGVYLLNLHNHTIIKRLQLLPDGLHIISTNKDYLPYRLLPGDMESLHIGGKVLSGVCFKAM